MWWRRGMRMIPWLALGCGPAVGTDGGHAADGGVSESSGGAPSSSTAAGTATDATSGADSTGETGVELGRCFEAVRIDLAPLVISGFERSARLVADAPMRLLFGGFSADGVLRTAVVAADTVAGPWSVVQLVDPPDVRDVGDIDGDGLDDVVLFTEDARWWSPQPDGMLVERGPTSDDYAADALVRIPGDPRAALAVATTDLELRVGVGDGTFAAPVTTPNPYRSTSFGAPVRAWGEGVLELRLFPIDHCYGYCAEATLLLQLDGAAHGEVRAMIGHDEVVVDVADVDDDGLADAFTIVGGTTLQLHRGATPEVAELVAYPVEDARVGDFDGDGAADLLTLLLAEVSVHWNVGGSWTTAAPLDLGLEFALLGRPADLDGDGTAEVVISDNTTETYLLLHMVPCGG